MKIILNRILKLLLCLIAIPTGYFLISILLTFITVNQKSDDATDKNKIVYLNTNGIHLDIIIPKKDIHAKLLQNLMYSESEEYISFGWGNEDFYINTPTWDDVTFRGAFQAMFLNGPTLMHLTRHKQKSGSWTEVNLNETELEKLNEFILQSFQQDDAGNKIVFADAGYSNHDNFYKANGSYSCLKTCNTWVNSAFKASGLKASYWTPFDFGLINKYK